MKRKVFPAKPRGLLTALMITLFVITAGASITGCDNGDSYEARLEDARIALDDSDYALAKSILLDLPQTPEVLEYLSNAIAGDDLNLDLLNILSTMADLEDRGDSGSIDMVGLILGDDGKPLSQSDIAYKLNAANEAIGLYVTIAGDYGVESLSDNQKIQLGLLAVTRTVLTLSGMLYDELGESVNMTEDWISDNWNPEANSVSPDQAELDSINQDMAYINLAVAALSDGSNDIEDDFEDFMDELTGGDNDASAEDLNTYFDEM